MKQIIIAVAALSAGAVMIILSRSAARKTRKPCMTFAELYEDNSFGEKGSLFD